MGGGGGKTTSSGSSSQAIDPALRPLFEQTGTAVQGLQNQLIPYGGEIFQPNPQVIPGPTVGQQNIWGAYANRAFGSPFNAYDIAGTNYAQSAAGLTAPEAYALGTIPSLGTYNAPEAYALGTIPSLGTYNAPELQALNQINYVAGGELGQSPATLAAMKAVRDPALNELAMAGLGNSDAVATSLASAYAPILSQEMATRAAVIPQLTGMGQAQRGGALGGAQLASQIGGAGRAGQEFAAQLASQIGGAGRAGQEFAAQFLGGQGGQYEARTASRLGEYAGAEDYSRQVLAQQAEAQYKDMLRRQGLLSEYTTGILSGFPSITGATTTSTQKQSGGGMSVICTELRRQGLMNWEVYEADSRFGESLPKEVVLTYMRWAAPVARRMRRSPRLTRLIAPLALKWAHHMRGVVDGMVEERSFAGALMLLVGVPICKGLGLWDRLLLSFQR